MAPDACESEDSDAFAVSTQAVRSSLRSRESIALDASVVGISRLTSPEDAERLGGTSFQLVEDWHVGNVPHGVAGE